MRERPILFSGPMVRALLEGRKTQTRRVVKPQPIVESDGRMHWNGIGWTTHHDRLTGLGGTMLTKCPFGRPGDRLWVRETWHPAGRLGTEYLIEYKADESERTVEAGFEGPTPAIDAAIARNAWRSPIHMPRWASRLTLEVTGARVERLHSLTEEDAQAEGVSPAETTDGDLSYALGFIDLWDSLNAKRGHPWDSNPWVWVVTFRRLEEARDA